VAVDIAVQVVDIAEQVAGIGEQVVGSLVVTPSSP